MTNRERRERWDRFTTIVADVIAFTVIVIGLPASFLLMLLIK